MGLSCEEEQMERQERFLVFFLSRKTARYYRQPFKFRSRGSWGDRRMR